MIVVSFKRLLISLCLMIIITLLLLITGISIEGGDDWFEKMDYQNLFFWGIVALILQIWISISLLLNHRKILKVINRLSRFDDLNSINADKTFRELGEIGTEIRSVVKKSNELSIIRTDRISALNNLAALLCEGYAEPVIITDVKGTIIAISEKLKQRIAGEAGIDNIKNIIELRQDLKLTEILSFIEKERKAWTAADSPALTCTPVFDRRKSLQFCIWEFETSLFASRIIEPNSTASGSQAAYKRLSTLNPFKRKKRR